MLSLCLDTSALHMKHHIAVRLKSDRFQAEKSLPNKKWQQNESQFPNYLGGGDKWVPSQGYPQKTAPAPSGFPGSYWAKGLSQLSSQPPAVKPTAQQQWTQKVLQEFSIVVSCELSRWELKAIISKRTTCKFIGHWAGTDMYKQNNPVFYAY